MLRHTRTLIPRFVPCVLFALLVLAAVPARAQQLPVGVRFGVSVDPDQFYFGAHAESRPLVENIIFRPNIEAGFGDSRTIVGLNGEFVYRRAIQNDYTVFFGMGPAINIISFDTALLDDTQVEPGINFLIGIEAPRDFFAELKVGAIDSPLFKFGIGYTFRP